MSAATRTLAGLEAGLRGVVIRPGDEEYESARTSFNGMIDRWPAAIVRPETADDVATTIREARSAGLPIGVRGGGHSVAGHGLIDGGCTIDLRRMRGVRVDGAGRRAIVEGGALWQDLDAATVAAGLAVPGGTFADTGVGGLTLGGGIGWLLGTSGYTCDNLVRAEVVTATGDRVDAGSDGDPELLWALRGGGGNFGVVTTFEFVLRPVETLLAGYLTISPPDWRACYSALRETAASAPPELVMMPIVAKLEGIPVFYFGLAYQGDSEGLERAIRPLRALRPVIADSIGPMGYLELQAMNGIAPGGERQYWKGHFLRDLDAVAEGACIDALEHLPGTRSGLLIEALTGRALVEPEGGAAFGGRSARWDVTALSTWTDPADDDACIAWARRTADGFGTASIGGGYANYAPSDEPVERIAATFGAERFGRLRMVKRRYDPDVVFGSNHTIPPA